MAEQTFSKKVSKKYFDHDRYEDYLHPVVIIHYNGFPSSLSLGSILSPPLLLLRIPVKERKKERKKEEFSNNHE